MSVGTLFFIVSFVLWFMLGIGVKTIPNVEIWAHASMVLGFLCGGMILGPFWRAP